MVVLHSVLQLLLGLAFFLFGMNIMSANLEKMAGGKLEHMLKKMTANPFISMVLGAVITIAVQSSSATTVMLVGLVNSGIMKVSQTLFVLFGANIGTTLTAWILSLSGISSGNLLVQMLKPENFSPILAFIGVLLMMMGKNDKKKSIGNVLVGFAILMYGMEFMKNAVSPLAELPDFGEIMLRFDNPLLGLLVGTLLTVLIQSSAASVGILQALALTGSITCNMAIPIVMGQNIGTCATAMISCVGTTANAKRVATIHLSINVIGTLILLPLYCGARALFGLPFADAPVTPLGVAVIHTVFNIAITVLLMPFTRLLEKLACRLVPDDASAPKSRQLEFRLDDLLLRSPSVAISECDNYTVKMGKLANETLNMAIGLMEHYDEKVARAVLENEDMLDRFEDSLGTYLVKLSPRALSGEDSRRISKMLHTIGDFERLGDHAVNLLHTAEEMHNKGITFSAPAAKEMKVLTAAVREILSLTTEAYVHNDISLAARVEPLEEVIDNLTAEIKDHHVERLQRGACTIEMGFVLSDSLNNYERISDHCSNIAVAIIELVHNTFETHQYLNAVKHDDRAFRKYFEDFSAKFTL